jgi:hypothetical protein
MAEALGISDEEYAALMAANKRWPFAAAEDGALRAAPPHSQRLR